jgi:hypothetical protein
MRTFVPAVLLLALTACASSSTGERTSRSRDVLTLEEIQESHADQFSAFELIRNRRPAWLRTRGSTSMSLEEDPINVYVDGIRLGGPEVLETIPAVHVEEARFYTAAQAQARFGLGNTNGAIAIVTRRG